MWPGTYNRWCWTERHCARLTQFVQIHTQLIQAKKMMKMQGQDITSKGAAPGAVVTVQCDYHAVSHTVGIVGIIYEASKHGGARVATECGILLSGPWMGSWWMPSDRYVVRYASTEEANIKPELKSIRNALLAGTYNIDNSAPKCSIKQAHQYVVQAISLYRKSKCGCANGACKAGCYGCIKKGFKCTSACSCNSSCTENPNNGKWVHSIVCNLMLVMNLSYSKHCLSYILHRLWIDWRLLIGHIQI